MAQRKKSTFYSRPEGAFNYQGINFDKTGDIEPVQSKSAKRTMADMAARLPVGSRAREQMNPFTRQTPDEKRLGEIKKALGVNFLTKEMVDNYERTNAAYKAQEGAIPQTLDAKPAPKTPGAPQVPTTPQVPSVPSEMQVPSETQVPIGDGDAIITPEMQALMKERGIQIPDLTAGMINTPGNVNNPQFNELTAAVGGTAAVGLATAGAAGLAAEALVAFNAAQIGVVAAKTASTLYSIGKYIPSATKLLFGGGIIKSVAVEGAKETAYNFEQSVNVFESLIEEANRPGADLEKLNQRWMQNVQYMQELGPIIARYSTLGHTSEWWYKAGKLARTYNTFRYGDEAMGQPSTYQTLALRFERAKQFPNPEAVRDAPFQVEDEGGLFGIF